MSLGNSEPVGLKLWSARSATTTFIGLAKKERKCAFRSPPIHGLLLQHESLIL